MMAVTPNQEDNNTHNCNEMRVILNGHMSSGKKKQHELTGEIINYVC